MDDFLILIVEDEVDIAAILKRMLQKRFPCRVELANSYNEGFAKVSQLKPNLLFIDVNLGDGNGYDLLNHIRNQQEQKNQVVMMSAYTNEAEDFQNKHAAHFIPKPFDKQKVLELVASILNNEQQGNQ